jgi:hypothetical protein
VKSLVCRALVIISASLLSGWASANADSGAQLASRADSLRSELAGLRSRVDSLQQLVARLLADRTSPSKDSLIISMAQDIVILRSEIELLRTRSVRSAELASMNIEESNISPEENESSKPFSICGWIDASGEFNSVNRRSSFGVNQVEADIEKELSTRAGTRADVELNSDGAGFGLDIEQAFLGYNLGGSGKWTLTFGKFNAPIGYERPDPEDIYLYSQGFLCDYGRPINLTGVMLSSNLSRSVDWKLYVVNGWDLNADNNTGKTVGGRLGFTPLASINLGLSAITGPERENNNASNRTVFDMDGQIAHGTLWAVGFDLNAGQETNAPDTGQTARWWGGMIIGHAGLNGPLSVTSRLDYFNDRSGRRTGIPQSLKALAISPRLSITSGLDIISEFRLEWSDQAGFTSPESSAARQSSSMALQAIYGF